MGGRKEERRGEKDGREGEKEEEGKLRPAEATSRQVMLGEMQIKLR